MKLQHPRLVPADRHAEGAVALAVARLGVDPVLAERALRVVPHPGGVGAELLDDERAPVFVAPRPALTCDGAKMSYQASRSIPSVCAFARSSAGSRGMTRARPRASRPASAGRWRWRRARRRARSPSSALGQDVGRALDRVERGSERDGPLLPDGDLGLVRAAADVPIGIRREVAHLAHRQPPLFAVQLELGRAAAT